MSEKGLVAAIILAAGSSSRMEQQRHKLLLPLGGRPVVAHVLETVLASQTQPIVIVLGHQAEQVRAALQVFVTDRPLLFVENPEYKQGMSTSLRVGLQALAQWDSPVSGVIEGALVLLGDQPLITAHIIDTLIATREASTKQIIAPLYAGKRGNPVLFSASLFPELMTVSGDEGGRSVIERHRQDVTTVEVGNPSANSDVDTWAAYQQVVAAWAEERQQEERQGGI
ncbi:MAG: molybdenum cofactor cytidylyltransferase [Ktedonobacteraceae bacterium]